MKSVSVVWRTLDPVVWATQSAWPSYKVVVPTGPTGEVVTGLIEDQTAAIFDYSRSILLSAGGILQDVVQVIANVLSAQETPRAWKTVFFLQGLHRATSSVSGLTGPRIPGEIVATAILSSVVCEDCP